MTRRSALLSVSLIVVVVASLALVRGNATAASPPSFAITLSSTPATCPIGTPCTFSAAGVGAVGGGNGFTADGAGRFIGTFGPAVNVTETGTWSYGGFVKCDEPGTLYVRATWQPGYDTPVVSTNAVAITCQ